MSTNRPRVYIAGPMRGIEGFNFPAFDTAAQILAMRGFEPISPADHDREGGFEGIGMSGHEDLSERKDFDLREALKWDLEQVAHADYVAVLPGWEKSSGARAEVALANTLSVPVYGVFDLTDDLGPNPVDRKYLSDLFAVEEPKPKVQVIGINGFARSGKDTAADHLVQEHGYTKMSMAGPLKAMLRTLDPSLMNAEAGFATRLSNLRDWSDDEIKASIYGAEYRRLLQVLGTDCIRAIDPDFWVKAMTKAVAESGATRIVVPDCRFPNEAEWVRSHGGIVVEVVRPGIVPSNGHASERMLPRDLVDHIIYNNGSIGDLHRKIRSVIDAPSKLISVGTFFA